MRRNFSEFIINEREQIMDSVGIAFLRLFQKLGDFAHARGTNTMATSLPCESFSSGIGRFNQSSAEVKTTDVTA
jgi:hypothetical protein